MKSIIKNIVALFSRPALLPTWVYVSFLFIFIFIAYLQVHGWFDNLTFLDNQILGETSILFVGVVVGLIVIIKNRHQIHSYGDGTIILAIGAATYLFGIVNFVVGNGLYLKTILDFIMFKEVSGWWPRGFLFFGMLLFWLGAIANLTFYFTRISGSISDKQKNKEHNQKIKRTS